MLNVRVQWKDLEKVVQGVAAVRLVSCGLNINKQEDAAISSPRTRLYRLQNSRSHTYNYTAVTQQKQKKKKKERKKQQHSHRGFGAGVVVVEVSILLVAVVHIHRTLTLHQHHRRAVRIVVWQLRTPATKS